MIRELASAGAHLTSNPREQRRVVIGNTIALMLFANSLMYAAVLYLLKLTVLGLLLIPLGVIYVLPIWLNQLGRRTAARLVLVTLPIAIVSSYVFAIGLRNDVDLLYAASCLPLIVCNLRDRFVIAWGVGLALASALFLSTSGVALMGPHLLAPEAEFNLRLILIVGTWGILLAITLSFELSNARSEREIRVSHAETQQLFDRVAQGFATLDAKGCVQLARSAIFNQWFGAPPAGTLFAECLGRIDSAAGQEFALAWSEFVPTPQGYASLLARLPTRIDHGNTHYQIEYQPGIESSHDRLMVVVSDVTAEVERKRGEEKQRALESELAQAQKLESIGRLAAGVAHEINTPVQFVGDSVHFVREGVRDLQVLLVGYQQLCRAVADGSAQPKDVEPIARAEVDTDLPYLVEQIPKALNRASEGLERVAVIVRSMKEFAHPDAAEKSPADLNRALQSTITVAANTFKSVAVLETQLGELPPVNCYLGSLNQVFLNLIVNAADAIAESRAGRQELGHILVKTAAEPEAVLISIGDDGAGIPESIQPRVFDQFFTTKPVGKGTGQGLSIAHRIVSTHGGSIWFESAAGKGTTFFIRLPIGG